MSDSQFKWGTSGMFPIRFIYTQRPSFTISIPWEQQAFAKVAALAMQVAEQQHRVLACAWHPLTDMHHTAHHFSPLGMRLHPNYLDFCEPERLGIRR